MTGFRNRREAGRELAARLLADGFAQAPRPVVFALVRGGVPVAVEVARALAAPLELLIVRKLGAHANSQLAVGAIAEGGIAVLDEALALRTGMTREQLDELLEHERAELAEQVVRLRGAGTPGEARGRTAIVVDDGLATGLSDLVAVRALRARGAAHVVVAVPVGSREAVALLAREADRVVCLQIPRELLGVGRWYEDFDEVSDAQVRALLSGL